MLQEEMKVKVEEKNSWCELLSDVVQRDKWTLDVL